jgi:hypothetical protein
MPGDVEEEFPVSSGVGELALRRTAKWNAAENERSSVEGEFLLAVVSFFADEVDGLQLLELELCEAEGR